LLKAACKSPGRDSYSQRESYECDKGRRKGEKTGRERDRGRKGGAGKEKGRKKVGG